MRKIAVIINFGSNERERRIREANSFGFEIDFIDYRTLKASMLEDYEVVFGMLKPDMLKSAKSLKWFHCSFAGVDKFCDKNIYPNAEVVLTNSAGAYGVTISEHMITTLLMLMRRMPEYAELQKNKQFRPVGNIRSVYGSKITVVGMGDIGSGFARRVHALGASVTGVRRTAKPAESFFDCCYGFDMLERAISSADVVALCVPETRHTVNILSGERIAALKTNALVLNVGRGSAIDENALAEALNRGRIAGAALDVFREEPLPPDSPLWTAKNCIITPHVSGNTNLELSCDMLTDIFINNLRKYGRGEPLDNVVDFDAGY